MRAVIIDKPGSIRVGNAPDPTPKPDELIVKVGACGICGTDLHISEGEFPPTPYPIIPGHEFAGEVVAVGSNIQGHGQPGIGARVAIDPSLFCGHCVFCRTGHGNLCQDWNAIGDTVLSSSPMPLILFARGRDSKRKFCLTAKVLSCANGNA